MTGRHTSWLARTATTLRRWFGGPPLQGLLSKLDDDTIDAGLARCNLRRRDLFTVSPSGSVFLKEMTGMLNALHVDLDEIVRERWDDLKQAEETCAYCRTAEHCAAWLAGHAEAGTGASLAALCFCPNARLFAEYMDRQSPAFDAIACRRQTTRLPAMSLAAHASPRWRPFRPCGPAC